MMIHFFKRPLHLAWLFLFLGLLGVVLWIMFFSPDSAPLSMRIPFEGGSERRIEGAAPKLSKSSFKVDVPDEIPAQPNEVLTQEETPPQKIEEPKPSDSGDLKKEDPSPSESEPLKKKKIRNKPFLVGKVSPDFNEQVHQQTSGGYLPKISAKGLRPYEAYKTPYTNTSRGPRIILLIQGLGRSTTLLNRAISQLPPEISLGFYPFSKNLQQEVSKARAKGHEVLLMTPMEPLNYPKDDPGPSTLLTGVDPNQNLERLRHVLSQCTGYVGITNFLGSRFTVSEKDYRPILQELKERGLLVFDANSSPQCLTTTLGEKVGVPTAKTHVQIDFSLSEDSIDAKLEELEKIAHQEGIAFGFGAAYPLTLDRVASWLPTLPEKNISLAPVSSMIQETKTK